MKKADKGKDVFNAASGLPVSHPDYLPACWRFAGINPGWKNRGATRQAWDASGERCLALVDLA